MTGAHHQHIPAGQTPDRPGCAARWCEEAAELGLLCGWHGQRIADHYGAREGHGSPGRLSHGLPWMWEHVQLAYPSLSGWHGSDGRGTKEIDDPEAEKLTAVLALRSDIHDHLTETTRELADRLGRHGPDLHQATPWAQILRTSGWLVTNIESLRAGQGIVQAGAEAVGAVLAEADELASRAHALAPWREAPTRIDGIPCRCGAVGTIHDQGDVRKCWRCGYSYGEQEWTVLTRVLAHRFADQAAG